MTEGDGDIERPKPGLGGTARLELDVDAMALYSCLAKGVLMPSNETKKEKKERGAVGRAKSVEQVNEKEE